MCVIVQMCVSTLAGSANVLVSSQDSLDFSALGTANTPSHTFILPSLSDLPSLEIDSGKWICYYTH